MRRLKEIYQANSVEDLFHVMMANFQDAFYSFGPINEDVANKIKDFFKIDITGYSLILDTDHLRHIYEKHAQEHVKGQRSVTANDLKKLKVCINYFDKVEMTSKGDDKRLVFNKKMPDQYYYELVVSIRPKLKYLTGITLMIKSAHLQDNLTPSGTSETRQAMIGKVNTKIHSQIVLS